MIASMLFGQQFHKHLVIIICALASLSLGTPRNADYYRQRWSQRNNLVVQPSVAPQIPSQIISSLTKVQSIPSEAPQSSHQLVSPINVGQEDHHQLDKQLGSGQQWSNGSLDTRGRDPRFFPLFRFITIANDMCTTSTGENGTCYTAQECASLGGGSAGKCAGGYGTCCIFQQSCGTQTSQNCTYFVNSNYPEPYDGVGSCQMTVNKMNANICQLRLDFDEMVLAQPESTNHLCLTDRFIVSGGSQTTPTICGTNNNNHMYVNVGPGATSPTVITFVTMGPSFDRKWKIKVSQIPCTSIYAAPTACIQYYQTVSGTLKSFNYDVTSGLQLSNQDYTICVRTEKNFCGIQYTPCTDTVNTNSQSFSITGSTTSRRGSLAGSSSCPNDWVTIPCVSDSSTDPWSNCEDRLCGDNFNIVPSTSAGNVPLYSYVKPFTIVYHTDAQESNASPSESGNKGFCLDYVQQPCV